MKISIVAAIFPPVGTGGAEDCARSFAQWASDNGHTVSVVTVANDRQQSADFMDGDVLVTPIETAHICPVAQIHHSPAWKKAIWHPQDHLSGKTPRDLAEVIARQKPDMIMIHYMQGFGYRSVVELARLKIPIIMVLHDLGLCCIRMSMFREGHECRSHCAPCRISTVYKSALFKRASREVRIGFISPSQANLDRIARYFPVHDFPSKAILNTKTYPVSVNPTRKGSGLHLLYAGRLEAAKGVRELAEAVSSLPLSLDVRLTIAGHGLLETELRQRFADDERIDLCGFVPQDRLSDLMRDSDLLCIPSLWAENSPGVAVQAIMNHLPIIATDRGGLPELVCNEVNGRIITGTTPSAWREELIRLEASPSLVQQWRRKLDDVQSRFDIDKIGRATIAFMKQVAEPSPTLDERGSRQPHSSGET